MTAMHSPGKVIRGYRILESCGGGGEGWVYKAAAPTGGRILALKQLAEGPGDPLFDEVIERARRLSSFIGKKHPHFAEIIEIFEEAYACYIVTEWAEGTTFRDMLNKKGRISVTEAVQVAGQVLSALRFINEHKWVHRDIKPENIMVAIGAGGRFVVKVIDLGIALPLDLPRITVKGDALGTLLYAAPEALSGGAIPIGEYSDLFPLGVVLCEALTGRYPFPMTPPAALFGAMLSPERPRIREHAPDVPAEIEAFVLKLMEPDIGKRFVSPAQALEALEIILSGLGMGAMSIPKTSTAPTGRESKTVTPAGPVTPALTILSGPNAGRRVSVPERGVCIGRGAVNPDDDLISRFHVFVTPVRGTLRLRDLGSRNGLVYAYKRRRKVVLRPGDELRLGATLLAYSTTKGGES